MKINELFDLSSDAFSINVPKSSSGTDVADIQKVLQKLGYDLGIDGKLGQQTTDAIKSAQAEIDQPQTGIPDENFVNIINKVIKAYPGFFTHLSKTQKKELKGKSIENLVAFKETEFMPKLKAIAEKLGVNYQDMMAIMYKESRLNPQARNKYNGATGLIQFTKDTAGWLGTSIGELYNMSAVEQLDWVYKYYAHYVRPGDDRGTIYMATFYPAYMHKPDSTVIAKSGSKTYDWNHILDVNGDKVLTVGDVKRSVNGSA